MVRDEGMIIYISYGNDGVWRVKTDEGDQVFAQTTKAQLSRPYGPGVEWEVKHNLLSESGMEPAPNLQVIPLNEEETSLRKVPSA